VTAPSRIQIISGKYRTSSVGIYRFRACARTWIERLSGL
jgi:hypothetical protein